MLDIRFIREKPELVEEKARQKGYKVNVRHLLELDEKRRNLLTEIEKTRAERNKLAEESRAQKPTQEQILQGRALKDRLSQLEKELDPIEVDFEKQLIQIPNIFPDDTPLGGEEAAREEKKWGDVSAKDFKVVDHLSWGEKRGLIDFERGAKVAGNKFYYLKGELVELELAVFQLGMELAKKYGFIPMIVPHLVNTRVLEGVGFSARGEEKQIYKVENEDLNLIATAEIALTGYHADEIIEEKDLPLLYVGLSPAYRVEGGAYGKYNKGLFRTHQFSKLELYVFCKPEDSEGWHTKMVEVEEQLCQALEIPYRIVRVAAGDLGAPAYKKYDLEYWSPVDKTYRELTSCSNVTDYQARNLSIRYRKIGAETTYVHTLNGTAAAMSRIPIALIENLQEENGKVRLPKALIPYMKTETI